jgi:hypothetical protein
LRKNLNVLSHNATFWELQDFIAAIFKVWPIRNSSLAGTGNRSDAKTGSPWLAIPDLRLTSHGSPISSTTPVNWNNEAHRHLESVE